METTDAAVATTLMLRLLHARAQPPQVKQQYASVTSLHGLLREHGFSLAKRQVGFGPKTVGADDAPRSELKGNGEMLFYLRGRLLVRIKTNGGPPHRLGQPHLTVSLMGPQAAKSGEICLDFDNEIGKFDRCGRLRAKSPNPVPGFQVAIRNQKLVANQAQLAASLRARVEVETWADDTHFVFPDIALDLTGIERLW